VSGLLVGLCVAAAGVGCSSAADDTVTALRPVPAGTYRLVGTEHDSRTGTTRRMVETFGVEPAFTRADAPRQITSFRDLSGLSRRWETEFRPTGAYRVRETADGQAWDWAPPLRVLALPLRVGTSWTDGGAVTLPDVSGTRRATTVRIRSNVVARATLAIGGRHVPTFVIETTTTSNVTDTVRATGAVTTHMTRDVVRTWFAPSRMRVVQSSATTSVTGDPAGGGYELTRQVQADRL
jgi:hypothetical protein